MPISDEFTLLQIVRDTLTAKKSPLTQIDSSDFDDCALVKIDDEYSFAISTDFVRWTWFYPFEKGFMSYYDVGWYLIWANLSDIASSGATPIGLTTIIRYWEVMNDDDFREVLLWMNDICKKYNTSIIGGDSWSYKADVFGATVFGKVRTKKAMLRKNVRSGDVVCVTGKLWDAFAAISYLKNEMNKQSILSPDEENELFKSWRRLEPKVFEWMLLSEKCERVACQDISDWFKGTVFQMSAVSWKTFTIYEDKLPISEELKKVANALKKDYLEIAFSASVDFELLCTMSKEDYESISTVFIERGYNLFLVWEVNENGKNNIIRNDGKSYDIPWTEWKQQSEDFIRNIISTK